MAALDQGPEIGAPQRLGRHADFKCVAGELGDGQAGPVDADAVAQVAVVEDRGGFGDGQGGAAAATRGGIVLEERGDG